MRRAVAPYSVLKGRIHILVSIMLCVNMIFIYLSNDSFVITEFEYFFTVLVYDFSILSCDLVFVNDCDFPNLFFNYFAQAIVI